MVVSPKVEEILRKVDALGTDERDALMRALDLGDSAAISAEWGEDLLRRVREIEEGKVQLVSEEDFLSKLRAV
jgi:hypothetical protein